MGNCCSNDDAKVDELGIGNKPLHPNEQIYMDQIPVNYGPLQRDEESLPNTVTFGQPVNLYEGEELVPSASKIQFSQQGLNSSLYATQQYEPAERQFRAAISSPNKTNRLRVVQQQEQGNFVTEPLALESKDTRCMELNKNLRTPQLSNSIHQGGNTLGTHEQPFYHSIINQNESRFKTNSHNNSTFIPQSQLYDSNLTHSYAIGGAQTNYQVNQTYKAY